MPNENYTAINNSSSKQMFAFSKSERFPVHKTLNKEIAYNTYDLFGKKKDPGDGRPFFHTTQRFSYYPSREKQGKLPSPFSNDIGHTFGK